MSRKSLLLLPPSLLVGAALSASAQTTINNAALELKLRAPDPGAFDLFGQAVDMDGNTAVIGAHLANTAQGGDAGAVYVFEKSGNTWTNTTKLTASDGTSSDYFGVTAAIDGDVIVVGAYGDDPSGTDSGSAYVFVKCNGVWTERQKLTHPAPAAGDNYGYQVAVDGNTVAISAYQDDTCAADGGSVWVYVRNTQGDNDPCNDTWTLQTPSGIIPSTCQAGAAFGTRIDLQGNRLVVGAYMENSPNSDQGAAYVFDRTGNTWNETAQLLAGDGAANDFFGTDVALDGTTIMVGAYRDDSPEVDRGSVYVFTLSGGSWFFQQKLVASDGQNSESFGVGIALQGSTAIIGAYEADFTGESNSGTAYLFRKSGSTWVEDQRLPQADGASGDEYGLFAAIEGTTALVPSRRDDDSTTDTGSVLVYSLSQGQFGSYGYGDGSATPCPCNNNSPAGREEGCLNSRGLGGKLYVAGSDSATADDFRMIGWNLIPGNPALLFSGPNQINGGAGVVFGNGLRLVGGFIVRRGIKSPNSDGRAIWGPGLSGSGSWPVGSAVNFQVWYRDPFHSSCVDVYNLTDARTITFKP